MDRDFLHLKYVKLPSKDFSFFIYSILNFLLYIFRVRKNSVVKILKKKVVYKERRIKVYIFERSDKKVSTPLIVNFHGGGFLLKASREHFLRSIEYAKKLNATVILLDYSLIPKNPYPIALNESIDLYKWILEDKSLNIDKEKIIFLGDSAGGNLALSTLLRIKEENLKMPIFQLLLYPVVDRDIERVERNTMLKENRNEDTWVWNKKLNDFMWKYYLNKSSDIYKSTLESNLLDFPETFIEIGEFDYLKEEGEFLFKRLQEFRVKSTVTYVKAPHGYDVLIKSSIVIDLMNKRIEKIKEVLKKSEKIDSP